MKSVKTSGPGPVSGDGLTAPAFGPTPADRDVRLGRAAPAPEQRKKFRPAGPQNVRRADRRDASLKTAALDSEFTQPVGDGHDGQGVEVAVVIGINDRALLLGAQPPPPAVAV